MPHYLLSMHYPTEEVPPPEVLEPVMERVGKVDAEMHAAGVWVFANGLHPASTATVVRVAGDGDVVTTDGPYLETKEHLGGFSIVDVPDLDEALAWATKVAEATGLPIEVRPFNGG